MKEYLETHEAPEERLERRERIFPPVKHGVLDLDKFVADMNGDSPADEIPLWMQQISEAEANRLYGLLNGKGTADEITRCFYQTSFSSGLSSDLERDKYLFKFTRNKSGTADLLRKWMERHAYEGLPEISGTYINKPGLLRVQEQKQLIKPNLRTILVEHLNNHPTPKHERMLVDVGTWDGELPASVQDLFGSMIGIEPNESRYDQLIRQAPRNLEPVNEDFLTTMSQASPDFESDVFLFSNVLYFFHNDADIEALNWAMDHLRPGGITIVVLNDTDLVPGSRAHLRKTMGVKDNSTNPQYYQKFFGNRGIATRMMRPTLNIQAKSDKGKVAMRDIMRLMIPGEARHDTAALDHYQQFIDQKMNGVLRHTLNIMVAYRDAEFAPRVVTAPQSRLTVADTEPKPEVETPIKGTAAKPAPKEVTVDAEPLKKNPNDLDPTEILKYLSEVEQVSWGEERKERLILQKLGIPWANWCFWKLQRQNIEHAAEVLQHIWEHGTIPKDFRTTADILQFVFHALRLEHLTETAFEEDLRNIGLYSRYYQQTTKRERRSMYRHETPDVTAFASVSPSLDTIRDPIKETVIVDVTKADQPVTETVIENTRIALPQNPQEILLSLRARLIESLTKPTSSPLSLILDTRQQLIDSLCKK